MILRLSQKLAKKVDAGSLTPNPPDPNPFADWSAHLFTADRAQYVIVTNTASLYSVVMHGRGIISDGELIRRTLDSIRELMTDDGHEFTYRRLIAPASAAIRFSTALNRSVTGSINDLVYHAKMWLAGGELSPFDVAAKLNEMPMSPLGYQTPGEAFKSLAPKNGATLKPPARPENLKHLPEERAYPHIARFLRSGAHLEIGEDVSLGCFAKLRIGNTTLAVAKMWYRDLQDVLKEMDSQARRHFERQDQ